MACCHPLSCCTNSRSELEQHMASNNELQKMAGFIVDDEARRDSQGHLAIYALPSGDGGGTYEVAGINNRYHPEAYAKIAGMIRAKKFSDAEQAVRDYLLAYTGVVGSWVL